MSFGTKLGSGFKAIVTGAANGVVATKNGVKGFGQDVAKGWREYGKPEQLTLPLEKADVHNPAQ